jgi:hypothetical protein
MVEFSFTSPVPLSAPISSPRLNTKVSTSEAKMDEEHGKWREELLETHC